MLFVATTAAWAVFFHLLRLPSTDRSGRQVLYYWHGTSHAWSAVCLTIASMLSLVLAPWVVTPAVRRVGGRWRVVMDVVGAMAWLAAAAYLGAIVFLFWLLTGLAGTQTTARGPAGEVVVVTRSYDGDVVDIWQQTTAMTYVLEPGTATVDPSDGPCRLEAAPASRLRLICGSTSQLLGATVPEGS